MQHTPTKSEPIDEFDETVRALEADCPPANALESMLLRFMAEANCRMSRINRLEAGLIDRRLAHAQLDPQHDNLSDYDQETILLGAIAIEDAQSHSPMTVLSRITTGADRRFHAAFKALRMSRQDREKEENSAKKGKAGPKPVTLIG